MKTRLVVFVSLAVALSALLFASQHRSAGVKVSGFVEGDEIRIGSRVGGRVARVLAVAGATVKKGDLLIELEPYDLRETRAQSAELLRQKKEEYEQLAAGYRPEEVAQAKFRWEQLKANYDKMKNGPRAQDISAAEAEVELADAEYERALFQFQQIEALFAKKAATPDQLDLAKTELKVSRASVKVKTEKLNLLKDGSREEDLRQAKAQLDEAEQAWKLLENGFRTEAIAAAKAAREAAAAALAAVDRRLEELMVRAPADGEVEAVELQPGDLVAPGAPALSLIDMAHLRVRAYVPENRMGIQPGQSFPVTVDSFPEKEFVGTLTFVARQAEFTPGNVQTPEERSKQVFRIRVELKDPERLLRPGMSADVWLSR